MEDGYNGQAQPMGEWAPKPASASPAKPKSKKKTPPKVRGVNLGDIQTLMRIYTRIESTSVEDLAARAKRDGLAVVSDDSGIVFVVESPENYKLHEQG